MNTITFNNGNSIPAVGFGVFQVPNDGPTYDAVALALKAGYRHIDTAAAYMNETDVGKAIRDSGIPREEIFVTSKLWIQDYGYDDAVKGIEDSLAKLDLGYIDLYLLHQPYGDVEGAWKALVEYYKAGKLKNIGISNFSVNLLKQYWHMFDEVKPVVDQVNCFPYFQQKELRAFLAPYDIKIECWSPLGQGRPELFKDPVLVALAEKYGKNVGQIILRWHYQEGFISLPKSVHENRIKGNIDIFDFALTDEEMEAIRALDTGVGHDPETPGLGERLLAHYKIHD